MLDERVSPTAVFSANDLSAVGVMAQSETAIPGDVSLARFENAIHAGYRHVTG
jgi:DNA-binding LacI/PurR family transcriptional regulator